MPTLLVRGPDGQQQEHELREEATVGRADNNDLVLTSGGVSRRHARLYVEEGKVFVEDTGSANGTWVDGQKLRGPHALGPQTKLVIGDYEISVKGGPPKRTSKPEVVRSPPALGQGGPAPTRTLARTNRPKKAGDAALLAGGRRDRVTRPQKAMEAGIEGPRLRGLTGPWANQVYPIRGKMLVGRVAGVQLQLDDDSVSRRHAQLEISPGGVVLKDLGSANGTAVNDQPISEEVVLQPGDFIQFGVVEMEFQDKAPPRSSRGKGDGGEPKRKSKLLPVVVVLLLLVFAAGAALKLTQKPPGQPGGVDPNSSVLPPEEMARKVLELLSECRSYSSNEMGNEPDWRKAEEFCNQALDLDPINAEANELIRRIKFEQESFAAYEQAETAMRRDRQEEALDAYAKITDSSVYFLRVKPRIRDAIEQVMRNAKEDCDRYTRNSEWQTALPSCETYMKFRCQDMTREQIHPPPGYRINLQDRGRLKKNEWRPDDPMFRKFLRVRARVDPQAPEWSCPVLKIIRPAEKAEDPTLPVQKALQARYKEKFLWQPLVLYWQGRDNDADRAFMKVREDVSKAEFHRQAEDMRRDAAAVAQMVKAGETAIQRDDVDEAQKLFEEALALDAKLMGDIAEERPSEWRRQVGVDFAEKSYEKGKYWADRNDIKKACQVWKAGFKLYKGNARVNKAIGTCTNLAVNALGQAGRCEDLAGVLVFAVPGDGIDKQVAAKMGEWGCK
jgi:pSer/pThr/pTyr-binding forkhead associated (FHA) protein